MNTYAHASIREINEAIAEGALTVADAREVLENRIDRLPLTSGSAKRAAAWLLANPTPKNTRKPVAKPEVKKLSKPEVKQAHLKAQANEAFRAAFAAADEGDKRRSAGTAYRLVITGEKSLAQVLKAIG